jgi:hypothetical protein
MSFISGFKKLFKNNVIVHKSITREKGKKALNTLLDEAERLYPGFILDSDYKNDGAGNPDGVSFNFDKTILKLNIITLEGNKTFLMTTFNDYEEVNIDLDLPLKEILVKYANMRYPTHIIDVSPMTDEEGFVVSDLGTVIYHIIDSVNHIRRLVARPINK